MPQPWAFMSASTSRLDQGRQREVGGGERSCGVVRREAPRVLGRCARIEIDADEGAGVGIVGTLVTGHDVVMRSLKGEDPAGLVPCAQPHNRGVLRARHDDTEPLGPEQRHRVEFDRQRLVGFVDRLPGCVVPTPPGSMPPWPASRNTVSWRSPFVGSNATHAPGAKADGSSCVSVGGAGRRASAGRGASTAAHGYSGGEHHHHHPQTLARFPGSRPERAGMACRAVSAVMVLPGPVRNYDLPQARDDRRAR